MDFKSIFGCPAKEILKMEYGQITEKVKGNNSAEDIVLAATRIRKSAQSNTEVLACSRIISAFIGGPDVMEC